LIGYLGSDAEPRTTRNNSTMTVLSLATQSAGERRARPGVKAVKRSFARSRSVADYVWPEQEEPEVRIAFRLRTSPTPGAYRRPDSQSRFNLLAEINNGVGF